MTQNLAEKALRKSRGGELLSKLGSTLQKTIQFFGFAILTYKIIYDWRL
jgi:hypothetical protein